MPKVFKYELTVELPDNSPAVDLAYYEGLDDEDNFPVDAQRELIEYLGVPCTIKLIPDVPVVV